MVMLYVSHQFFVLCFVSMVMLYVSRQVFVLCFVSMVMLYVSLQVFPTTLYIKLRTHIVASPLISVL